MLDKGNILSEITRLKNLEIHHQKISEIQNKVPKRVLHRVGSMDSMDRISIINPIRAKSNFKRECKFSTILTADFTR